MQKTNQILNLRCFGISDSRKLCTQISSFFFFNPWKRYYLRFSCFSWINDFEKNLATRQILNWKGNNASQFDLKENNASDFELKKYSASEFETKETTRQILKLRKHKALEFELKLLLHVRFGIGKKTNLWILNLDFYYMSDSELESYNALDFEMKFSLHDRFCIEKKTLQILNLRFSVCRVWKKCAYKNHASFFFSVNTTTFAILVLFFRSCFWNKFLLHVRFWKEKITTRHSLI